MTKEQENKAFYYNPKHFIFRDVIEYYRSGWVIRKHAEFPQRGNPARIQASLSSPFWRGTVPAQPFSRFSPPPSLISGYHFEIISLSRKMKCFSYNIILENFSMSKQFT